MKFYIENIDTYEGEDLIFMTGSPGSRWSSTYKFMSENDSINTSDHKQGKTWDKDVRQGKEFLKIANHRGTYWGPYNSHGKNFDKLNTLTKEEIISEFMYPFDNWDKIKVIKSHWFSYHIEYLSFLFPKAKIVSCYANDIDCFYWWHKCGGWGISYPNYYWYENDTRLLEKIKEENYRILKFNRERKVNFQTLSLYELYNSLNLSNDKEEYKNIYVKSEVAIYMGNYIIDFDHIIQ
jgi:hypothetical protein